MRRLRDIQKVAARYWFKRGEAALQGTLFYTFDSQLESLVRGNLPIKRSHAHRMPGLTLRIMRLGCHPHPQLPRDKRGPDKCYLASPLRLTSPDPDSYSPEEQYKSSARTNKKGTYENPVAFEQPLIDYGNRGNRDPAYEERENA